ncbi:MAG: cation transporter [Aureispira sp.]|nr:cation transporter [Aureispira sp.]
MGHDHHHHHGHDHHHHAIELSHVGKALILGIILNLIFVGIEVLAGFYYNSLGLLSDAGHNLSDVAGLLIALLAFKLMQVHPTSHYTYGYKKTTVLAAFVNALILFVAVGVILWESIERFQNPVEVGGLQTAIVAGIGIVINTATALLFLKDKDKDLNIKGAYLHMVADALVSLGVVISGLAILYTDWYWIDTVVSLVIVFVIIGSSWGLFKKSIRLILDGVPEDIDVAEITTKITNTEGVESVHHIHVWALSTTQNALTAHLVVQDESTFEDVAAIKAKVKHLLEHESITHATLEIEKASEHCLETDCEEEKEHKH